LEGFFTLLVGVNLLPSFQPTIASAGFLPSFEGQTNLIFPEAQF